MIHGRSLGALAVALALASAAAAQSQTQTQTTRPPAEAPAPGTPAPASPGAAPAEPTVREVTGRVKKVDAVGKTVEVSSGPFGIVGRTLEITDDTQIRAAQGRHETLASLQEGARVRAEYESRDGRNLAKAIEILADEERTEPGAGRNRPGTNP